MDNNSQPNYTNNITMHNERISLLDDKLRRYYLSVDRVNATLLYMIEQLNSLNGTIQQVQSRKLESCDYSLNGMFSFRYFNLVRVLRFL